MSTFRLRGQHAHRDVASVARARGDPKTWRLDVTQVEGLAPVRAARFHLVHADDGLVATIPADAQGRAEDVYEPDVYSPDVYDPDAREPDADVFGHPDVTTPDVRISPR